MGAHSPPRIRINTETEDEEFIPLTNSEKSSSIKQERRFKLSFKATVGAFVCLILIALYVGYLYCYPSINVNSSPYIETEEMFVNKKNKTKSQLHGHHSTCDCYSGNKEDDYVGPGCCDRVIWRAHKFGTILTGDLFARFRHARTRFKIQSKDVPEHEDFEIGKWANDYRHVIVTRNWKDAIVSGYLYHKAGYECWINFRGTGNLIDSQRTYRWFTRLPFYSDYYGTYQVSPQNNRSLCQYLADESEEDGIKVIMDIALSKWYKGVVLYNDKAQERLQADPIERSMFLCFEDFIDPFQQEDLFHRVVEFMFPGRNYSAIMDMPRKFKESLEQQKQNHSVYSGGHASTHDPEVRARLKNLVDKYDAEIFNHTVATSSAVFGCGGGR